MSVTGIILAAAVVGGTGLVISILLGIASEKFKVPVDEKEIAVRECLPGNNCGGCGYPGCSGLAAAIVARSQGKRVALLSRGCGSLNIGSGCVAACLLDPSLSISVLAQKVFANSNSFSMLAVPAFYLAGDIMCKGGLSKRLVTFADSLVGWISGGSDGTFQPGRSVTRAEAVKILNRAMGRQAGERDVASPFADVSRDHWAYWEILEAAVGHDYEKNSQGEIWL